MIRRILVGLDGSSYSNAALDLAIDYSRRIGCTLVGIAVVNHKPITPSVPSMFWPNAFTDRTETMVLERAGQRTRNCLDDFVRRCTHASVGCDIVEIVDRPETCLPKQAEKVDLLMLGSRTFFHSEHVPDRENAVLRSILRHSPRPVVTVPTVQTAGEGVLFAYDGSVEAAHALQAFQNSGLDFGEKVHLLSADSDEASAAETAYRAVEFLRSHGIEANALPIVSHMPVSRTILNQALLLRPRMIAMGAFGRSAFHEITLGSVTHAVLDAASAPVFMHH